MTIGRADADQAGARTYQHRCAGTRSRHARHMQRRGASASLPALGGRAARVFILCPSENILERAWFIFEKRSESVQRCFHPEPTLCN
jgi:hypothetical protein